ncbi:MAG: HAMP domain-containing histidine kinase [Oscillospiraceae bacterium]|nr:HAMP domain-containing histidine kinase [Oscillospiraceae bacterium]
MRKSIVSRFFSAMSMVLVASISTLGVFFMFFANRYFQADRLNLLNMCVINAQAAFDDSLQEKDGITTEVRRSELRENLRLISNTTSTIVILADENGRCIVCTEKNKCSHEGSFLPTETMKALTGVDVTVQLGKSFDDIYDGAAHLSVGRAARDARGNIIGYVLAFSDASSITVFSNAILSIFMVCAGSMLTVSSIVSIVVAGRLTTPLRNISDAARRFSQGDFGARVKVDGDDEVAQLATTFNQMASFVEKNEKSRSSFVANIAHELRTPMTSIKGFVDGMLDGTIPPEMQERYLTVISDEVGRLARLTNSMLDISKLESGEFIMNVANYNIWDTIAAIAFAFENRIEDSNITLRGFAPEKIMVNADKDLIHQVVYNIFDNALKFTPENGYITFNVTEDKSAGKVTVKIRNSGRGISKDALPYIFERFYKEDSSRSVHTRGAGIGLYISKTLVQRSGGDIWAESEEGQYTEFIFTVPNAKQSQPKMSLPTAGKGKNNKHKVKKNR